MLPGGVCMAGGVHGEGGLCMAKGGVHGEGERVWQETQPLQRAIHILLECILV